MVLSHRAVPVDMLLKDSILSLTSSSVRLSIEAILVIDI